MANIIVNRTRLKQKKRKNYKSIVIVDNDPTGNVNSVEVTLQPSGGVVATPSTIELEKRRTRNGKTRYIFGRLGFENGDPNGSPFVMNATMKDATGTTVGTPETMSVTVQDNDGINVTGVTLIRNEGKDTFTLKVVVKGTNISQVATVDIFLTPLDGGAEADPEEFDCSLVNETANKKVFKNKVVEFDDPDGVVDMQYSVEVTLEDTNGDELDYMEFDIVAAE